jgi:ribonuclease III
VTAGVAEDLPSREFPEAGRVDEASLIAALSVKLGSPRVPPRLLQALTHPSFAHEHPPTPHNETLAFLGDAVLGLVVAELLVRHQPDAGPGTLTVRRAELVSTRGLAGWARAIGLDAALRLGRGEAQHGGREKDSVLASGLEAVVAALYLDGGLAAVARLVGPLMRLEASAEGPPPSGQPGSPRVLG